MARDERGFTFIELAVGMVMMRVWLCGTNEGSP